MRARHRNNLIDIIPINRVYCVIEPAGGILDGIHDNNTGRGALGYL